jgi:leucyl aminopeptidase
MDFSANTQIEKRKKADLIAIPFWKGAKGLEWAVDSSHIDSPSIDSLIQSGDFKGTEGELFYLYDAKIPEKRIILLGLGPKEKVSMEGLRRSYGNLTKHCLSRKFASLNLIIPQTKKVSREELLGAIAEGILLPNYVFDKYKQASVGDGEKSIPLQKVCWLGASQEDLGLLNQKVIISEGVYLARDLINGNADEVTPQFLVQCAQIIAKEHAHIKATIFDKKRIEKEGLHLLLSVNRGSHLDPAFIILEYKGLPKSKEHVVMVGKGITYDTGGLNLKPTGGMETMKCDMSGAAACLGAMLAVARLKPKVNFSIVIPTTENGIDAKSFKPGDVYQSYAGKTVEMTNSDAEGRLVLADALAYAVKKLAPTQLIDIATLTGAIEVALGSEASGLMSTDDKLADRLIKAGERTFERLWRMPLYEEYKERLKSDIADLKSWNGRGAGSNVAATFLRAFVDEKIPWAHIDIAGTAYLQESKKYQPKFGIGVGVRLILEYLQGL